MKPLPVIIIPSRAGFYYMSNAAGRFVGTLCSGAIYQYAADDKALGLGCAQHGTIMPPGVCSRHPAAPPAAASLSRSQ